MSIRRSVGLVGMYKTKPEGRMGRRGGDGSYSTDPESGAGGATSGTGLTGEHSSQVLGVQSSANRVSLEMRDDEEGVRLSGRGVGIGWDGSRACRQGQVCLVDHETRRAGRRDSK